MSNNNSATILKVTQSNKVYILEFNGQTLFLLNNKALWHHLKHEVGFNSTAITSFINILTYQPTVEVDLLLVERRKIS